MMQTKISDLIDRRHVVPGLLVTDKDGLLDELAQRAAIALKVEARAITTQLHAREQLGSTGVGHGIAIPHARIAGVQQPFGLFVRLDHAIDFDAVDGSFVDLVFLLLLPATSSAVHLSALAAVSRRLRDPAVARSIRDAATAKDMFQALIDTQG